MVVTVRLGNSEKLVDVTTISPVDVHVLVVVMKIVWPPAVCTERKSEANRNNASAQMSRVDMNIPRPHTFLSKKRVFIH
jgi:hypothetical protein